MKKRIISTVIIFLVFFAVASAQLRYGIRLGGEFTHPTGEEISMVSIKGGSGFVGGLQLEYQLPMCGLAFGVAALYEHRTMNLEMIENGSVNKMTEKCGGDFIGVPIDVKYKFDVGILHNLLSPYVLTGPDLAFRLNQAQGSSQCCLV